LTDRPGNEDVIIGELRVRIDLKILIADIATPNQCDRIVCD